ncbi:MAG: hypothetical protein ABIY52_03765 [Gemmatimonadaceae bacterium]
MRADDGFVHAWTLPADIGEDTWTLLHADLIAVLRAASARLERSRSGDDLAVLRGPGGLGRLVIEPDMISFNGNAFLGQAGDGFSIERRARQGIIARVGSLGHRRTVRRCDTRGHPYDLAVSAMLLVVLRYLGDVARVGTSGSLRSGWAAAAGLVRETVGECGQLVQMENGMLRWVDAPARHTGHRISSAS